MKLHIITIVLDGMPFITWHYPILRQLYIDWTWHVVEGVALPVGCTSWCAKMEPRLSGDGTSGYLEELARFDSRVDYRPRSWWPGKAAMFNAAMAGGIYSYPCVLMQIDSDEIWTVKQIEMVHAMLASGYPNCMNFRCRYFVGPDLAITSREGFGNHTAYEWKRAWRVGHGAMFETHEPPRLAGFVEYPWTHEQTENPGLVFDHFAYATRRQMEFKKHYYASTTNPAARLYDRAVEGWEMLQKAVMPVEQLNRYLPWVGEGVRVERLARPDAPQGVTCYP